VIDMQVAGFPPGEYRHDADGVVRRINGLAKRFRARSWPVIFVQHDGSTEGEFVPGTPAWALLPALEVAPGDTIVAKAANDAFYRTGLASILAELGARELVITGWATDFCVDATIRSALSRDYDVVVVADGHTCGQRPHLMAQQVIDHHNWVWSGLTPTMGSVRVITTEELLKEGH
jgi:nicotinamidase-related amidase